MDNPAYQLNATFSKWPLSLINCPSAIGNSNYCRTSITSINENVGNNTNTVRDGKELLEISQQR